MESVEVAKKALGHPIGEARKEAEANAPEMFGQLTEAQRAWGKLIGKIILAESNDDIEDAFTWFAEEHNDKLQLRSQDRMMAFFHALGSISLDERSYREIRQMYLKAKSRRR